MELSKISNINLMYNGDKVTEYNKINEHICNAAIVVEDNDNILKS